ncbi:MAG: hypothetical protein AMJ56_11230 [Anaerolineae bacterium SG8_19]|nr:MAG: hypothetical protein AMJ56_11230 [Anaerolineae bacterium SG8_19]
MPFDAAEGKGQSCHITPPALCAWAPVQRRRSRRIGKGKVTIAVNAGPPRSPLPGFPSYVRRCAG